MTAILKREMRQGTGVPRQEEPAHGALHDTIGNGIALNVTFCRDRFLTGVG